MMVGKLERKPIKFRANVIHCLPCAAQMVAIAADEVAALLRFGASQMPAQTLQAGNHFMGMHHEASRFDGKTIQLISNRK